jgi:hypothetical protein
LPQVFDERKSQNDILDKAAQKSAPPVENSIFQILLNL